METERLQRLRCGLSAGIILVTASLLIFEVYTFAVVYCRRRTSLPENYGNFVSVRNLLKEQGQKEKFSFAVVGDTRGTETFERLCDKLRNEPLSFMVMLGDFVDACTLGNHDYFRSECADKYRLPFPVFLIAGNHDVVSPDMDYSIDKVSLADFERMYGPRNFYFEYSGCLFIGLCILPYPASTDKSLEFLDSVLAGHRDEGRKVFVFTYVPAVRSTGPVPGCFENVQAFIDIIDRHKVDYVISSHYHGYDRTKWKNTVYLVTGGGGAPLDEEETFGSIYHASVLKVDSDSVSERTVLVGNTTGVLSTMKHFAVARLSPFIRRHPALTVVESVLVFGMFCVSLHSLSRLRRTTWSAIGRGE